jgi:mycofactocin system glycosyltransferase
VVRLAPAGDRLLDRLLSGEAVPPVAAASRLARRLIDGGMAHPRPVLVGGGLPTETANDDGTHREGLPPPHMTGGDDVTAVVPVRDQAAGLGATLAALGPTAAVVVVDDGSTTGVVAPAPADAVPTLVRHAFSAGPGAARNTGWRSATTPLVAFVDAECEPRSGWLDHLLPLFSDPTVGAVAPRVVSRPVPGAPPWLVAYEAARSCLDLGGREGPVRPRSWVPYAPTAALVVRRRALEDVGGFDEALRTGEDVDLVWRMNAAGWRVRYQPAATVTHPVRPSLGGWLRQRIGYGRSAAPLARRHGGAVAPLSVSLWSAGVWALVVTGHPNAGAVVTAGSAAALAKSTAPAPAPAEPGRMSGPLPVPKAALAHLAVTGHLRSGEAAAAALVRAWWPVAFAGAVASRRARKVVAAAIMLPAVADWARSRPRMDLTRWLAAHLADDLAYGVGVWAGCVTERSLSALRPVATRRSSKTSPFR